MQDFRKIKVRQKAIVPAERLEAFLPGIKKGAPHLADQLERAVESIAANIAEGAGRHTKPDFRRFLSTANGSATEAENHLIRAHRKKLLTTEDFESLVEFVVEIRKMLHGFRKALGG